MHRLKAFFTSVVDKSNSETYAFWGSVVMSIVCHASDAACSAINTASTAILNVPANVAIAGLFGYAVMRMSSKAAKTPAPIKVTP